MIGAGKKKRKTFPALQSKNMITQVIRCGCKGDCNERNCTCRLHNLKCSNMCGECKGVSCLNCYEMNKSENEWLQ